MPSYLVIISKDGRMNGIDGPMSSYQAQKKKDRLESKGDLVKIEILDTPIQNKQKAIRNIKSQLLEEHGFTTGAKRMRHLENDNKYRRTIYSD